VPYAGPSLSGSYTASSANASINTILNNVSVPGVLLWGVITELVLYQELYTIAATAQAAGAPVSFTQMNSESHQWLTADTNIICGTSTGWVQSNLRGFPRVH
jgi:hypothetical protein